MEANTVILPLEDYNKLKEFEKVVKEGKCYTLNYNYYTKIFLQNEKASTVDDVMEKIIKINEELVEINDKLRNERIKSIENINLSKRMLLMLKEGTVSDFKKWRKSSIEF